MSKRESAFSIACCTLIGTGVLLPFNAFVTAYDFWEHTFHDFPFEFYLSAFYNAPNLFVLLFFIIWPNLSGPIRTRLLVAFALDFVMLGAAPFLALYVHHSSAPYLVLLCSSVTGAATALSFAAAMSLASLFGPKSITGIMTGNGISGMVAGAIRIITKLTCSATPEGAVISGIIYFSIAAFTVLLCIAGTIIITSNPETKRLMAAMNKGNETEKLIQEEPSQAPEQEEGLGMSKPGLPMLSEPEREDAVEESVPVKPRKKITVGSVFKKVWLQFLTVFMVFFCTLSLFPGVTTLVKPNIPSNGTSSSDSWSSSSHVHWLSEWFPLIMLCIFQMFDFVGRSLPSWIVIGKPNLLWIPVVLRFSFYAIFSIMAKGIWHTGTNYWGPIMMFIFAITNGYLSTLAMMWGPLNIEPEENDIAATIMTIGLNGGIVCGSFFSFVLLYLITGKFST